MRAPVEKPNLPDSCSALLYGSRYETLLAGPLEKLGIDSLLLPDNPDIDPRLGGHADLSVLHAGGRRLFLAPYLRDTPFSRSLQERGMELYYPAIRQKKDYPDDAQLNLCVIGDFVIENPRTADPSSVNYLTSICRKTAVPCRQGYSRCAVGIVRENALITADRGIGEAAFRAGLQVLAIEPGHIVLDGYPYGFIGGASFRIASDKLAFTGHLEGHPDRGRILDFLRSHQMAPVYLTDRPLFDIGSAIPIFQDAPCA